MGNSITIKLHPSITGPCLGLLRTTKQVQHHHHQLAFTAASEYPQISLQGRAQAQLASIAPPKPSTQLLAVLPPALIALMDLEAFEQGLC